MTGQPVIVAERVTKIFRDFWGRPRVRAVDDLSFEVRPGEVFGLLGPNGSGKSTTIKMILGLLRPTAGALRVFGHTPGARRVRARLGYLPEESYLYPYLTAEETLDFFGRLFDLAPQERRRRVSELLEMVGLAHARRRPVGEFSKGMARRVGLAQALINDPDLVVLDEPTSGLDPLGCRQVKDLIRTLAARGKTVLLSSHLLADVEDVCDRILVLYNGRRQAMGPIAELLEDPEEFRILLRGVSPEVAARIAETARAMAGRDVQLDHPRRRLEDFFLAVIRQAAAEAGPGTTPPATPVAQYLAGPSRSEPPSESPDDKLRPLVQPPLP